MKLVIASLVFLLGQSAGANAATAATSTMVDALQMTGENSFILPKAVVRDAVFNQRKRLARDISIRLHKTRWGTVAGYRIHSIKSGSIFEALGLKRGDLIRYANNIEVLQPDDVLPLTTLLKTGGVLEIEILRHAHRVVLTYSLE